ASRLVDGTGIGLTLGVRAIALKEADQPGSVAQLVVADRRFIVLVAESRQAAEHGMALGSTRRRAPSALLGPLCRRGLFFRHPFFRWTIPSLRPLLLSALCHLTFLHG